MEKQFGKCALCRKDGELTFEHIPPKMAFNSWPVKSVSGDQIAFDNNRNPWELDGLPYENQQKGMGKYSLCKGCNNATGRWFGKAYQLVAQRAYQFLREELSEDSVEFIIKNIYPLRFVKQVLSMFCSVNNFDDPRIDALRSFVLDEAASGLDKKRYKLCMYLTVSPLRKLLPITIKIYNNGGKIEPEVVSEITARPLGFILYFDLPEDSAYAGVDITNLGDYSFNDKGDIHMPLCLYEVNDFFPTYYRTKDEILQCVKENKEAVAEWEQKHEAQQAPE